MKATPFDSSRGIAPIPFSDVIKQKALEMKNAGLKWEPQTGCFVWDMNKIIQVPSPFPGDIYFVLNLNHFLKIFVSLEEMQKQLVWLPTWYQGLSILDHLGVYEKVDCEPGATDEIFVRLYSRVISQLTRTT